MERSRRTVRAPAGGDDDLGTRPGHSKGRALPTPDPADSISETAEESTSAHRKACIFRPRAWPCEDGGLCLARRDDSPCHLGLHPDRCAYEHVAARVPKGSQGDKSNRLCPVHDDRKASLSINPGKIHRVVWHCGAECSEADIRDALLDLGVHPSCLGNYGLPRRTVAPGLRIVGHDPALVADAKRYHAIYKLPADLNGSLLRMCIQAISEGDGDLPGDPYRLLPVNRDDFLALAQRTGLERGYAYRVFRQWMSYGAA